jgi:hypothetical protein
VSQCCAILTLSVLFYIRVDVVFVLLLPHFCPYLPCDNHQCIWGIIGHVAVRVTTQSRKVFLCNRKNSCAVEVYEGLEVYLHAFLTSILCGFNIHLLILNYVSNTNSEVPKERCINRSLFELQSCNVRIASLFFGRGGGGGGGEGEAGTNVAVKNRHRHLPPWIRSIDLFRHRRVAIVS